MIIRKVRKYIPVDEASKISKLNDDIVNDFLNICYSSCSVDKIITAFDDYDSEL